MKLGKCVNDRVLQTFMEPFLGVNGVAGTKENFGGYYVEVSRAYLIIIQYFSSKLIGG